MEITRERLSHHSEWEDCGCCGSCADERPNGQERLFLFLDVICDKIAVEHMFASN